MAETGAKSEAAVREEKVLAFWQEHKVFEKSLEKNRGGKEFVFFEGPPTANGKPGIHHLESRAFKDAIPRYKTMRGFRVPRRAGWDTHGLPVELEVQKELGLGHKKDIETYGVAAFNKKCRESVLRYVDAWEKFTTRIGYWVDESTAYFTFNPSYMEALWGIVKQIDGDGRLFKDYKVVPWCPHDETVLSSHELAQGYEDVSDLSVTAKFELIDEPDTFLLAWTTTPWTLPGNVGLAVGPDIEYVKVKISNSSEIYVVAKERLALGFTIPDGEHASVIETINGSELVGKGYKPLYPFAPDLASVAEKKNFDNAYKVYAADFVTTEDGTGIVHTAVMYGQEDFELGTKVGLPKVHLVNQQGLYVPGTGFLEGKSVVDEETTVNIIQDLAHRGLLFAKAKYQHSYPFCWRCKTRLIYYARDSWYFRMQDLSAELVAENKKVHWEPSHIRDGRMGEWLTNVKDWAISRERYWATPLPVWRSADGKEQLVIGSVDELKVRTKKSGNTYFVMRHGEAENNVRNIMSTDIATQTSHHLTEAGKVLARESAIAAGPFDLIFSSPFTRTRETAQVVAEATGYTGDIVFDERIREIDAGTFEGKSIDEWHTVVDSLAPDAAVEGGESHLHVRQRMGQFLYELEGKYEGKRILIVSHGHPLWELIAAARGISVKQIASVPYPERGKVCELDFVPLPHNEDYELDLHRPYIDDVALVSEKGTELKRVPDVMDVWFDSGSMPFAQDPGDVKFPADYISEAIDQTRGWFYTLLAVGVLTKRGHAYKNVICLGHLLDAEGKKMSKSKGNVVEPWAEIEKWGADTVRFWMYSVNQPGDSKNYDEKTVKEANKVVNWLSNSTKFYELFKDATTTGKEEVIDRWIKTRVHITANLVTTALDSYDLYGATRNIAILIEDLSQWYVRRIRDRAKEGDTVAVQTLRSTLRTIALLIAPFTPFIAEDVFQTVRSERDVESVHLAEWPESGPVDMQLDADMASLRGFVAVGLRKRQEGGVNLRQPLASLKISGAFSAELSELIKEELNVKEIISNADATEFDFNLTPELVKEGDERAVLRAVAEARKTLGLSPKDKRTVVMAADGAYSAETSTGTVRFNLDAA